MKTTLFLILAVGVGIMAAPVANKDVDDLIVYPEPDVDDTVVYPEADPDSGIIYPDLYTDD